MDFPADLGLEDGTPVLLVLVIVALFSIYIFTNLSTEGPEGAIDFDVPEPEQLRSDWKGQSLENPSIKTSGSNVIQCYAPATGERLALIKPVTQTGIDQAISLASEAQKGWADSSFPQRRRVLKTMLKFILENQESIARAACLDSGKTRVDASFGEILVTVEKLKWTIDHGEKALRPEKRPTNLLMMYKTNEVRWEPLGVVAAIVSWNYPFHNLFGPIISGIFAGNAVIVKGSEQTAWSAQYFTSIARGALEACGHEPNLIQTIVCWPSVAPYLNQHPGISHLTFIGSREVGLKVAASAAKSLTHTCMELGGKDASILLDDVVDVDRVVATLVRGTFQAAGQNCIGIERIICLPKIYGQIVPKLTEIIGRIRPGSVLSLTSPEDVVDMGASISSARYDRLEELITDAIRLGAQLLVGGQRYIHPQFPQGHYFAPTLVADVTPSMALAQEELFAPICVVMRATTISEAISIANGTMYGLGGSVFGSSRKDLERVTKELKCGMVAVNDFAAFYAVQLPFGGVKGSGYGRFAGEEGLRSVCSQKSVCIDRFPSLMKTSIPSQLRIPLKNEARAWDFCKGIVEFGYGETMSRKFRGVRRLFGL